MHNKRQNIIRNLAVLGAVLGTVSLPMTAAALSYSNANAAVSSGDKPFSLTCEFDRYDAVGTYRIDYKKAVLPPDQTFAFNGRNVITKTGALQGYVFNNAEHRRDWRMETGKTGSPIYRFTHFKESDEIVANVDILGGGATVTLAAADESHRKESHVEIPDIHSVKGHCRWNAGQ